MTSRHDNQIWEIIWACRFDLEHTTDPKEEEMFRSTVEWEMKESEDAHEPEAIAWRELDTP
jgi:hypothetical protein